MAEFFDPVTEGLNDIVEIPDAAKDTAEEMIAQIMREASDSGELGDGDASWLEELLRRVLAPVIDIFDGPDGRPQDYTDVRRRIIREYDIDDAVEEWHVQDGDSSCAICSQQFIINEFLDLDMTEEQLCLVAEQKGWYNPQKGTLPDDVDNLLEYFGIETDMQYGGTYEDLKDTLDKDGRVIVSVDSAVLWTDGYQNYPIQGADHAIEVIGIDDSDKDDVMILVNDSGVADGCGKAIPLNEFMEAWTAGGSFMVSAYRKD